MFQVIMLNNQNQLKTYKIQLKFILVLSKSKIVDYTYKLVIIKIHRTAVVFNPLTPRRAEFSRRLQCRTIYRKKMKKDRKLHILPFLGSLFRMAQSESPRNDAKPFIFPKVPKTTLFLRYDFFLNLNFHYVPELRQRLTY